MSKVGDQSECEWGRSSVLSAGKCFCILRLDIKTGQRIPLHYHHNRSERWFVVTGTGIVERDEETLLVQAEDLVRFPQLSKHPITNTGRADLILLEIRRGTDIDQDDVVEMREVF